MDVDKVAALESELRQWKEKASELEAQKAELESREIRLGKRVMKEIEEREGMSKTAIEAERREHSSEVLKLKNQIEILKAAEMSAKAKLSHVETVEVRRLEAKVESAEAALKLSRDGYQDLQGRLQQQITEKDTELAKALEEKRQANTERIAANSSKEVMERRLQQLTESTASYEGALRELRDASRALKKETSERESALRREVRQLKASARSYENEILTLKKQHENSKDAAIQAEDKVQQLKIKMQEMIIAHSKEQELMAKEKRFAENEIERMKLFAQRLEEGRSDDEIVGRLLGDSCHLDETALQKLATAQRLVADELDLSMTNAYSKWLELRQRLQLAESENSRLIDNHAAIVEACETMAPAIFNQQRECQQLIKQQYKLQSSNAQLSKAYNDARGALNAEKKKTADNLRQISEYQEQIKNMQMQLKRWLQEPIETEKADLTRVEQVYKRNVELEEKVASLWAKVKHETSSGAREKEIEERAREKVEAIKQEFDTVFNENTTLSEQAEEMKQQRDNVFRLLADYSTVSADLELQTKLSDIQKETGVDVPKGSVDMTLAAVQSALNAEASQCRSIQVSELKSRIADLELKLRNTTDKLEDVSLKYSETEAQLQRELDYREEMHYRLHETIDATTMRGEEELKRQQEVSAMHREQESTLLELRTLKRTIVQEQEKRELAEQEVRSLTAAKESLEKLYRQTIEDNKIMNGFAVEVQLAVDGVRSTQDTDIENKNKLLDEQLKKITQLEELRKEEREDWINAENRLKLRLKESKTQQYAAEDESRRKESEVIKLKHELESSNNVRQHLESRTAFLEKHLKKVLTQGTEQADQAALQTNTIETLQKEVAMLKDIRKGLETKFKDSVAEWEEAKSEREILRSYNTELANRVEELENTQKNARELASSHQKQLQEKLDKVTEEHAVATQKNKEADEQAKKQTKLFAICENEKITLIQDIEVHNQKITNLQQQLEAVKTEKNKQFIELSNIMGDAKKWKEENNELKKKATASVAVAKTTSEQAGKVAALQKEVEALKAEKERLLKEATEKEQVFEKLTGVIVAAGEAAVPKGDAQVAALKQLLTKKELDVKRGLLSTHNYYRFMAEHMDDWYVHKDHCQEIGKCFEWPVEYISAKYGNSF
eukprot:TRINITY_DN5674_c0_g1_i9.p1 TRINITY_DN5674_c0_g1~~TRINITY_DN5674_c0_g1_i9.p1  ORF type:complete len:1134 (+),score=534.54 TRINITY_DN5674_c0_g1_i9:906-4307(+)